MLEAVEEALDAVSQGVGLLVDGPLDLAVRFRRYLCFGAAPFQICSNGVAVVALVGDKHGA